MKLSVSTWAYYDKPREEAIARIAALGVDGIELIAHQPCFHVDVDFNERMVGYVRGLLTAYGLKISAISPATEFLVFEPDEMAAQLKHMRKVADLCARLGADHARIFAGGRLPAESLDAGMPRRRHLWPERDRQDRRRCRPQGVGREPRPVWRQL